MPQERASFRCRLVTAILLDLVRHARNEATTVVVHRPESKSNITQLGQSYDSPWHYDITNIAKSQRSQEKADEERSLSTSSDCPCCPCGQTCTPGFCWTHVGKIGDQRYWGAVEVYGSRVVFMPGTATDIIVWSGDINGKVATKPNSFLNIDISYNLPNANAASVDINFCGGTLMKDGRVVFTPYKKLAVLIYDPAHTNHADSIAASLRWVDITATGYANTAGSVTDKWFCGAAVIDVANHEGKIFFPPALTDKAGIFDPFFPTDPKHTLLPTAPLLPNSQGTWIADKNKFESVAASSGRFMIMAPKAPPFSPGTNQLHVFDANDGKDGSWKVLVEIPGPYISLTGTTVSRLAASSTLVVSDGNHNYAIITPVGYLGFAKFRIDTAGTCSFVDALALPTSICGGTGDGKKFTSAFLAPNNHIVMVPYESCKKIIFLDWQRSPMAISEYIIQEDVKTVNAQSPLPEKQYFSGGAMTYGGDMVFLPSGNGEHMLTVNFDEAQLYLPEFVECCTGTLDFTNTSWGDDLNTSRTILQCGKFAAKLLSTGAQDTAYFAIGGPNPGSLPDTANCVRGTDSASLKTKAWTSSTPTCTPSADSCRTRTETCTTGSTHWLASNCGGVCTSTPVGCFITGKLAAAAIYKVTSGTTTTSTTTTTTSTTTCTNTTNNTATIARLTTTLAPTLTPKKRPAEELPLLIMASIVGGASLASLILASFLLHYFLCKHKTIDTKALKLPFHLPDELMDQENHDSLFHMSMSMDYLLNPPPAISAAQDEQIRRAQANLAEAIGKPRTYYPEVFLCAAVGKRPNDAEGTGTGAWYVSAILKLLFSHGIPVYTTFLEDSRHRGGAAAGDHPGGRKTARKSMAHKIGVAMHFMHDGLEDDSHKTMMSLLTSREHICKVLIVVETDALYEDKDCLEQINSALKGSVLHDVRVIVLRFQQKVMAVDDRWDFVKWAQDKKLDKMLEDVRAVMDSTAPIPTTSTVPEAPRHLMTMLQIIAQKITRPVNWAPHPSPWESEEHNDEWVQNWFQDISFEPPPPVELEAADDHDNHGIFGNLFGIPNKPRKSVAATANGEHSTNVGEHSPLKDKGPKGFFGGVFRKSTAAKTVMFENLDAPDTSPNPKGSKVQSALKKVRSSLSGKEGRADGSKGGLFNQLSSADSDSEKPKSSLKNGPANKGGLFGGLFAPRAEEPEAVKDETPKDNEDLFGDLNLGSLEDMALKDSGNSLFETKQSFDTTQSAQSAMSEPVASTQVTSPITARAVTDAGIGDAAGSAKKKPMPKSKAVAKSKAAAKKAAGSPSGPQPLKLGALFEQRAANDGRSAMSGASTGSNMSKATTSAAVKAKAKSKAKAKAKKPEKPPSVSDAEESF